MDRKTVPESEQRLIILEAMTRLGPVTELQLLQFMVETDLMNYFTLQLELAEMLEERQVALRQHACGPLLEVAEKGRFMQESFADRIPASRRDKIEDAAKGYRPRFRAEQQSQADAFPLKGGRQCVRLRLLERDTALMDLTLTLATPQRDYKLRDRWRGRDQEIYMGVTALLSEGYDEEAPMPPLPAGAQVQCVAEGEWFLSLTDLQKEPQLNLMLSLPTEKLARWYASRWPDCADAVVHMLLAAMTAD